MINIDKKGRKFRLTLLDTEDYELRVGKEDFILAWFWKHHVDNKWNASICSDAPLWMYHMFYGSKSSNKDLAELIEKVLKEYKKGMEARSL